LPQTGLAGPVVINTAQPDLEPLDQKRFIEVARRE